MAKKSTGTSEKDYAELIDKLTNTKALLEGENPAIDRNIIVELLDYARFYFHSGADTAVQSLAAIDGFKTLPSAQQFKAAEFAMIAAIAAVKQDDRAQASISVEKALSALGKAD
jgi:hypothetical protein